MLISKDSLVRTGSKSIDGFLRMKNCLVGSNV
jgi:hypothetical protein